MLEYRTCRICSEMADSRHLFKYGTRHYAHWSCYFTAFLKSVEECKRFLLSLPTHVIGAIPVLVFAAHYRKLKGRSGTAAHERQATDLATGIWKQKSETDAKELAGVGR